MIQELAHIEQLILEMADSLIYPEFFKMDTMLLWDDEDRLMGFIGRV